MSSEKFAHLEATKRVIGQLKNVKSSKKKINTQLYIIAVVLILVLGFAIWMFVTRNGADKSSKTDKNEDSIIVSPTTQSIRATSKPSKDSRDVKIEGTYDDVPESGVLYLVEEENGEFSIFVSNNELSGRYDDTKGELVKDEYYGLVAQGDYTQSLEVNYKSFKNAIRLVKLPSKYTMDKYTMFADHFITSDNKKLYVSFIFESSEDNEQASQSNVIVEIDLKSKKLNEVWAREIGNDKYGEYLGAVTFREIVAGYLETNLLECYNCASDSRSVVLIINIDDAKDLMIGEAKNIVFDIENKKVIYETDNTKRESDLP